MAGKVKSLFWISGSDDLNYVRMKGLPTCMTKCPYEGRDKRAEIKPLLNKVRRKEPPSMINFVSSLKELAREADYPPDAPA